ncbi:twin-arginine translocation pathway signal protein [Robertkochia solimangrovi]|nr:twin-arginine translocation pathway signal protein [Robertkochia solimangrovi]
MKRRDYLKKIVLGSVLPLSMKGYGLGSLTHSFFEGPQPVKFESDWHLWEDMSWAGPEYWGNRLQDWKIENGKLVCDHTGMFRTLHVLTFQNADGKAPLKCSVRVNRINGSVNNYSQGCVGFLLGAKGPFDDYRSAAVFGKGLQIGLTPKGTLKVGDKQYDTVLQGIPEEFFLEFQSIPVTSGNMASVKVVDKSGKILAEKSSISLTENELSGNLALLADFGEKKIEEQELPSIAFEHWHIESSALYVNHSNLFGPICFAQYTLHDKILKITGQLAPIERLLKHKVILEFKRNGKWEIFETTRLVHSGRAVNFRISDWEETSAIPYRLRVEIPVGKELYDYIYEGTIAKEPAMEDKLKVAVFSCNFHYGFPDNDIPESLEKLEYDMSVFLGDQFYEGSGGYGVQYSGEYDKICLDYLRKWMMFGWSYREIFRHKPCAIIPDDHDVFHGNVWGEEGKPADVADGFGASAQDSGGYKMPPEWVNMVQFTQTSHLPDPVDPRPVKNGIGVYFTNWNYGGISFAILEDRKFKSAPKHVLPEEAEIWNGWIFNEDFDIKEYGHLDAELLGERQEEFLEDWAVDWSEGIMMKAVLSQTNFATVATLPKGTKGDDIIPKLYIPERNEYIMGDAPTADMDSNGWPKQKRDKAVSIIRKALAFHIAGDQHLGSFIQYGVEEHKDAGFAFAGPALNNIWPRRFWPETNPENHTRNTPAYTGDHIDGFGNRFTALAVGNPYNRHRQPETLYNRANGFGLVEFDKKKRTITTSCFERFKDPLSEEGQYPGWPVTVRQEDNYLLQAKHFLPSLHFKNNQEFLPVIQILDNNEKLVYSLRIPANEYQPLVRKPGTYSIQIDIPEIGFTKRINTLLAMEDQLQLKVIGIKV